MRKLLLAIVAAAFITAVTAPAKAVTPTQPFEVEVPAKYSQLVIYFHGAGETVESIKDDPQKRPIFDMLESKGYIVAYSNAHGEAWGNPDSVNDYKQLYTYLKAQYRFKDTVFLAQSMGGLPALNTIAEKKVPGKCLAGIYPASNLVDLEASGQFDSIHTAYPSGIPVNPVDRHYKIPMLMWHSTADTVVPASTNTEQLIKHSPKAKWIKTAGNHGDDSNFDKHKILKFYSSCLKKAKPQAAAKRIVKEY